MGRWFLYSFSSSKLLRQILRLGSLLSGRANKFTVWENMPIVLLGSVFGLSQVLSFCDSLRILKGILPYLVKRPIDVLHLKTNNAPFVSPNICINWQNRRASHSAHESENGSFKYVTTTLVFLRLNWHFQSF